MVVQDIGAVALANPSSVTVDHSPILELEAAGGPVVQRWLEPDYVRRWVLVFRNVSAARIRGIELHWEHYRKGGTFKLELRNKEPARAQYSRRPVFNYTNRERGTVTATLIEARAGDVEIE